MLKKEMTLYTVQEVASILKVTEGTMRNYLAAGKINFIKVLGNVRITQEELERHIKPVEKEVE